MANTVELVFGADQARTTSQVISDLQKIAKNVEASGATKLKFAIDSNSIKSLQTSANTAMSGTSNTVSKYSKQLVQYYKDLDKQNTSFNQKNLNGIDYEIKQREIAAKQFSSQLQSQMQQEQAESKLSETNAKKDIANAKSAINAHLQYNNVLSQAKDYYEKYSSSIQKNAQLNAKWQEYLNNMQNAPETYGSQTGARAAMSDLTRMTREAGLQVETLRDKLSRLFGIHLSTALTMVGIHALTQALTQVYQNVVELDKAVVNLQVATGYSREQTQALISEYSQYAKELGATTTQVAEASDTWLRQGYSIEQSNALIKDSMMLSKLGQMDSADATNSLTSAMRGYQMSVQDVTGIVDRLVKVDMSAAVSSSFIATAMSETATSADLAGISMDQLIGYIATIGSTTQDSAESVGNSLKTMFARMGNIKQGLLEDPETGESLSGVESSLSGVGIKLRDSNSEFRNFGDVLNEVAGKWDSYSSVQKRALSVSFAGTRQQEKFLVLMQHYNEALGYTKESTEAAGTAIDKFSNTYLKSVEAAQDRATASFENFSNTVLNSDLVAGAFNTGSGLLDFLTKVIDFGDGAIVKIGLLIAAVKVLDALSVGKILPLIPEMVGVHTFVNCWEIYERYCDYKAA